MWDEGSKSYGVEEMQRRGGNSLSFDIEYFLSSVGHFEMHDAAQMLAVRSREGAILKHTTHTRRLPKINTRNNTEESKTGAKRV